MEDNRREFQEMMGSACLERDRGLALLEQAEVRLVQRKKRVKNVQTLLAIMAVVVLVGGGAIYAATGGSFLNFFLKTQDRVDDEMFRKLGEECIEAMETYEFENWRVVLERYWFEQKSGSLFAEISIESIDGSPLIDEEYVLEQTNGEVSRERFESLGEYAFFCYEYYHLDLAKINMGMQKDDGAMEYVSDTQMKYYFKTRGIPFGENTRTDAALVGLVRIGANEYPIEFKLENTGEWQKRKLDPTGAPGAVEILMNAMKMTIEYESDEYLLNAEDYQLILHMKDGEIRYEGMFFHTGKSYYPVKQKEDGTWTMGHEIMFRNIIDVNQVEKIVLNGQEILFLDE